MQIFPLSLNIGVITYYVTICDYIFPLKENKTHPVLRNVSPAEKRIIRVNRAAFEGLDNWINVLIF